MSGRVILVGGGPGDPDLITVRGLDRLMAADVVIADRLGPVRLLDRLGPNVEIVDAARSPGSRTLSYDEIVALMIDRSRAGKTVVRLKGGDPFIFAHGAQEVRSCTDAGIPVEVVPGVTSATAAPTLAGVPLTSTVGAVGFTVVSGHLDPADAANRLDWTAVARSGASIVILMGMRHLPAIVTRLIADGVPPDTPSHCVAEASLPSQRSVGADLTDLPHAVADAGLTNPAVVVIEAGNRRPTRRVLVLGGSGSGKSEFAERLLAGTEDVCYVATASTPVEDAEWLDRIERHRIRRPASWSTAETADIVGQLAGHGGSTLLVDSITTWLARAMDAAGCWDDPAGEQSEGRLRERVDDLVTAWRGSTRAVVVSDEVGSGIVPATVSGRQFRDQLGRLNQRLAAAADEVYLVTAGIGQRLR
jgi:uroporphyrin-III C-methyltransferase